MKLVRDVQEARMPQSTGPTRAALTEIIRYILNLTLKGQRSCAPRLKIAPAILLTQLVLEASFGLRPLSVANAQNAQTHYVNLGSHPSGLRIIYI